MKGWLAFDIDGTITSEKSFVPTSVCNYFKELYNSGWQFVFLTGRSYTFSKACLFCFDFPYYFSAQNGSMLMEMPSKKIIFKNYLTKESLVSLEKAFEGLLGDFIVTKGVEFDDVCCFRPQKIPAKMMPYVKELQIREKEEWIRVQQFELEAFPVAKCIASLKNLRIIEKILKEQDLFEISILRDPFFPTAHMLMVTKRGVNKGSTLMHLVKQYDKCPIITAGNDNNDISLLDVGDINIAMENSPKILLKKASYIAPSATQQGILTALRDVLSNI
jgi:HAD superfamily hydrolase (TIGR01484 family)